MFYFHDVEPALQTAILQNTQSKVNQQSQTVRYECNKCDSIFTTRLYLHHHETMAHNRIFHCPFCEVLFSNKADYQVHVDAHTEKRMLPCAFCKKVFHDVDEYTIHTKMHAEPIMYKCDKCSAMFSQLSKLRTHSAAHVSRKFFHTIPKLKKKRRLVCPCTNPIEDDASNQAENNGGSLSCQTERPPGRQEDSEPDPAPEPEAGCSRSHESKENSPERISSSSNRKRKKKVKNQERRLKKMKVAEKSTKIDSQTLPVDNIEILPRTMDQMPSTSRYNRVTRQQDRLSKNKKATERITETDCREFSDDEIEVTSATEKQIPSNSAFKNTARKRGTGRSRKDKRGDAETEIEAERLSEENVELIAAPEQPIPSTTETPSSEDQKTDAGIRSITRTQVLRRPTKRVRPLKNQNEPTRFDRVLRSRLQNYRNAESETEAGRSTKDNVEITRAPEEQVFSSNQEILSSEEQEPVAEIASATRKPVSSQTGNKKMAKKRPLENKKIVKKGDKRIEKKLGRPLKDKIESTRPERGLYRLRKYRHAETITEPEASTLSADHLELNSTSTEPVSLQFEELFTTFEQRTDGAQVNGTTRKQPLSSAEDQNVALKTGAGDSVKGKETNCPEHDPKVTAEETSLRLGEVTSCQRKQLSAAKKLGKVPKPQPTSSSQQVVQKAAPASVSVVRNVTGLKIPLMQSNATISRITVLKAVPSSRTSVELSRANEATSGSQTSTANHAEQMPRKRRPIYESTVRAELTDTAAKSSTDKETDLENADSVYTFEEESLNKKASTFNTDGSRPNKRRQSELWKFFVPLPKSPRKKAKTATHAKRRKSVHFYQCSRCTRQFPNNESLSKHELIHTQRRGFPCTLCGGVFGGAGNLISHKKLTHDAPF